MIHVSDVLNFELWLNAEVEDSEVSSMSQDSCWNDNFKQPKKAYSSIFYDSLLFSILFNVNHVIRWYSVIIYRHSYIFVKKKNVMKRKNKKAYRSKRKQDAVLSLWHSSISVWKILICFYDVQILLHNHYLHQHGDLVPSLLCVVHHYLHWQMPQSKLVVSLRWSCPRAQNHAAEKE